VVDHRSVLAALRARLATLVVCTTGATTLSATPTGYARTTGSFFTDGFAPGMELLASGFALAANNGRSIVITVAALTLTVRKVGGTSTDAAAAGRTLSVGVPAAFGPANTDLVGVHGVPSLEEEYKAGPLDVRSIGPQAAILALPTYILNVCFDDDGPVEAIGTDAPYRYAGAILALFPPELLMPLSTGEFLRVRADQAPYQDDLPRDTTGSVVVITIPLRVQTYNSI
jgi:hypothetical protein